MGTLRLLGGLCLLGALAAVPAVAQDSARPSLAPHTIPEGTTFLIRLEDKLDTSRLQPGKHFKAKLSEDLVGPDGAMIPGGKKIKGHVSSVDNGFHSRLLLSFDEIETEHGWAPLIATVTDVPGERGIKRPDEEGEIERKGANNRHEVERAGIGAGVGAAGGAVAGGGRGAAIGAGIGAVAGAVSGLFTDRRLRLEKGTTLELRLDHPLQVPWH
jgi:YMGG-like Gly-zipper